MATGRRVPLPSALLERGTGAPTHPKPTPPQPPNHTTARGEGGGDKPRTARPTQGRRRFTAGGGGIGALRPNVASGVGLLMNPSYRREVYGRNQDPHGRDPWEKVSREPRPWRPQPAHPLFFLTLLQLPDPLGPQGEPVQSRGRQPAAPGGANAPPGRQTPFSTLLRSSTLG